MKLLVEHSWSDPERGFIVADVDDPEGHRILAQFYDNRPGHAEQRARQYAALLPFVETLVACVDVDNPEDWPIATSVLKNAVETIGEAVLDSPRRVDQHGLTFRHTVAGKRLRFTVAEER
jgi:hypothetical protein